MSFGDINGISQQIVAPDVVEELAVYPKPTYPEASMPPESPNLTVTPLAVDLTKSKIILSVRTAAGMPVNAVGCKEEDSVAQLVGCNK